MSIFSSILAKIFPADHPAVAGAPAAGAEAAPAAGAPDSPSAPTAGPAAAPSAMPAVDVEQVLNGLAAQSAEKLNWRTSIVDLMKLLQLDSSLNARRQLAGELRYSGDTADSAAMNVWLHKQVLQRVAANGGKVPAELQE